MAEEEDSKRSKKPTHRIPSIPTVTISEPPSPEKETKMEEDEGRQEANGTPSARFEGDSESIADSVDQSQVLPIHNFDMSTLSLNLLNADGTGLAEHLLPIAPDGGYGWVIVLAAFMSNLIVDGICNSFSEVKNAFAKHYGSSQTATAFIGSLLIAVYLLVGPIVGGFVNKYGARNVVIAGSIVSSVAFVLSTFAPNVYIFMLIYGVMGGVGFGMIYLPAIVVVGYYFESKRAIATGIAVAGSGVGTIIMPKLSNVLVQQFGWQGTVYVYAGLMLICAAFGFLYRPLELSAAPLPEATKEDIEMEQMKAKLHQNMSESSEGTPEEEEQQPPTRAQSHTTRTSEWIDRSSKQLAEDAGMDEESMAKLRSALGECEEGEDVEDKHLSPILENKNSIKDRSHTNPPNTANTRSRKLTMTSMNSDMLSTNDLKSHTSSRNNLNGGGLSRVSARSIAQSMSRLSLAKGATSTLSIAATGVDPEEFSKPMNRKDIFYTGSIRNLKEFDQEGKSMHAYRESVLSIPTAVLSRAASKMSVANGDLDGNRFGGSRMSRITGGLAQEDDLDDFYDDSKCKWIPLSIRTAFGEMIDLELLKNPVMLLLCISNVLGMMGFYIPFMFLKDLAVANEMDEASAGYLIPIIGIFNTAGRIFFGWFADRRFVTALTINNFSLTACGVLCCVCIFWTSFTGLAAYSIFFGFIISAYICLTSIVLSDLLGLENLTNSFGLLVVARGIASLIGAPFAGFVYDVTKSYDYSFLFAGGLIVISGIISCFIPCLSRWSRNKGENEEDLEKDADAVSGKLSVLTERSEENLTEYQRTIQSLRQQHQLLQEIADEKKRIAANERSGPIGEADNENDQEEETATSALLPDKKE